MKNLRIAILLPALAAAALGAAIEPVDIKVSTTFTAASGEFAPYYIMSNNHGVVTSAYDEAARISCVQRPDSAARFSYSWGIDAIGRYASAVDYTHYDADKQAWTANPQRPAPVILQQLYLDLKYRCLYFSLGARERGSAILDDALSSGDFVYSGNARPMPEVRAAFHDFVNVPFTRSWLQVNGVLAYGLTLDGSWVSSHFNYFSGHYNSGWYYNYKRFYFRTNPRQPLSATFGMQASGQFGGTTYVYADGGLKEEVSNKAGLKEFLKMIVPGGGERYYYGNHVGSWDMKMRWRFTNGNSVAAYFQWPWEDGSGIGKKNGFDGLWGVEFHTAKPWWVSGAVIEYLDFTNQSGPLHWDPSDISGTTLQSHVDGADNYYNHFLQNSYSYYGMAIGTPMLRSPIYNLDGQMEFLCNRVRGVHIGVTGTLSGAFSYRMLYSYRKGWGTPAKPIMGGLHNTSAMVEVTWQLPQIKQLTLKGAVAIDRGTMYGNNFGALISATYSINR